VIRGRIALDNCHVVLRSDYVRFMGPIAQDCPSVGVTGARVDPRIVPKLDYSSFHQSRMDRCTRTR
jgi:hypothetical protein